MHVEIKKNHYGATVLEKARTEIGGMNQNTVLRDVIAASFCAGAQYAIGRLTVEKIGPAEPDINTVMLSIMAMVLETQESMESIKKNEVPSMEAAVKKTLEEKGNQP